ncbi:MAG TPA: EAL domain-containing protein [Thermomonas sp.]|jgi:diguanylate cyclase (GGDEF)-like protein|uniref:putative bifunctional diguanylate cyclase/phosphodiesterase n=1 Tax=Thermomonas sp. TaxID=1971895 RepID=UPI002C5CC285|nr:EAL domain-containing protein [Thermomonas sp.]HOV95422.1 EAL domain-containing protein [Thermomonas sp.]
MKRSWLSLQARFQIVILAVLALLLLLTALLWHSLQVIQNDVIDITRQSTHSLLEEQLRSSGEAQASQLADALSNPLYYFDLDAVGTLARGALRAPDVEYVLVYDAQGRILHDGSGDIAAFGKPMNDALAPEIMAASGSHTRMLADTLDVSAPIRIGDETLGGVRIGYSLARSSHAEAQTLSALHNQFDAVNQRSLHWLLILCAVLAVFALLGAMLLQRLLVRPLNLLGDAIRQTEAGDFSSPIPESRRADEIGDLIRAVGRMRESLNRHDREIRRVAYSDALTGMANRLAFRESLESRLRALQGMGQQLALLFADLDDFKRINDTLGHEAGDEVLQQVALRIEQAVQTLVGVDVLVARFGGDEFVLLLQLDDAGVDASVRDKAIQLAEALVRNLSETMLLHGRQVLLGVSVGVAIFPEDAVSVSSLLKNGDIAMYQAKVAGKNCYRFYSQAMDQAVERRVRMEHDLRGAWERGELSLVYQPIYRTRDHVLVGAESLLRWNHPEDGAIAPSLFIDVAEQCGLIEQIGAQVLLHACQEAAGWQVPEGAGEPPFISVNVSARQLRSGDLIQQVADALELSGLAAERLHLELTETAVISDELHATELLGQLRQLGVRVWLDDFGTGFSSLSHLRRVQVDGLKIDRSFISDLLRDPDDLVLTSAIIAMAHSMGVVVVAEGVERQGQFDLLRERDCDLVQGFWLGYPLEAPQFVDLLH